jgi:UDP-glucuronate 4-epimerase
MPANKYVVTGCAGFIGSHVAAGLLKRGDQVIGVDNLNNFYDVRRKERNLSKLKESDGFEFHRLDVRDKEGLKTLWAGGAVTAILHLAAMVGVRASMKDPLGYFDTNAVGTLNMLELARVMGSPGFVQASSSSVYGDREVMPLSETDSIDQPVSPYAASKKSAEILCRAYSDAYRLRVTCLRFFTAYGPGGRPDMAPFKFMDAIASGEPIEIYGDGSSERDYTYVEDIASGVLAAVDRPFDFEIINLGNSQPVSLNDFVAAVEEVVGKEAKRVALPAQEGDVRRTFADISKAERMLGFSPKTSLRDGLSAMYEWYRSEGRQA